MDGRVAAAAMLALSGCVTQSHYDTMLSQQQAIEAAQRQQMATLQATLPSDINADQVKIEQLESSGIKTAKTICYIQSLAL